MKGFKLKVGGKVLSGAVEAGFANCLVYRKEGRFRIDFGAVDTEGVFYTWHARDLEIGDSFEVEYTCIDKPDVSQPVQVEKPKIMDVDEENKLLLESYYKMKEELINERLISL